MSIHQELPPEIFNSDNPVIANCEVFGRPVDPALLVMIGDEPHGPDKTIAEETAEQLEFAHAHQESDIHDGTAAKRAVVALGCGSCVLNKICPIEEVLAHNIETKARSTEVDKLTHMLTVAPRWLTAGRLRRLIGDGKNSITEERASQLRTDHDGLAHAMASGEVEISELRGSVDNEFVGLVDKESVPEISHLPSFKDTGYEVQRISTDTGHTFDVIDASINSTYDRHPISDSEYMILAEKLLGKMLNVDSKGNPQIVHADGTIQRVIHSATPAKGCGVFEFRMNGKDRLYVSVRQPQAPDEATRVVILGSHGGDEASQNKFINNVLSAKSGSLTSA